MGWRWSLKSSAMFGMHALGEQLWDEGGEAPVKGGQRELG